MKSNGQITRRRLLAAGAIAAAAAIVPRHVLGGPGNTPPSEKLNIAGVGVGGQGGWDLDQVKGQNIVALADVDWGYAARTFDKYPRAVKYKDFREMLDKEKGIDAVIVGTPDHAHAIVSMAAIKRGKHVYCEKPLTRTVYEARALALAAREHKVATQMGNQGMAFEGNRLMTEWLEDGAIGPVREAHVWSDRPTHSGKLPLYWAQGIERPKEQPPVPSTLDWDLWLGPAPLRPYHPAYAPFRWRGWWDFGSGGLGDMGIHNIAPVFSALKLGAPTCVYASSTAVFAETLPLACCVHYEFPARDGMPPVNLHWYDGGLLPSRPDELEDGRELDRQDGSLLVGDKGKMLIEGWGGSSPRLIPEKRMKEYKRPPKSLPRSVGHHSEWLAACKGNGATRSNFDFAGPLTEAVLLGTICVRVGGHKLNWDAANLKFTNSDAANALINPPYRKGWSL
ncbi:MAG: Gfo/Idh/MocA family oxidoreductase [Planctomycetota bacterium]|nr:Gfo/Idh/MocA family oxidoreductase [Planctomycetota bacterium]